MFLGRSNRYEVVDVTILCNIVSYFFIINGTGTSLSDLKMATNIANKFGRELDSFFSLTIVNVALSGIAMALSISLIVANLAEAIEISIQGGVVTIGPITIWPAPQFFLAIFAFIAAALALRWLIASAEILSDVDDLRDEYKASSKPGWTGGGTEGAAQGSDALTSLIVKTMAYYRSRKTAIRRLSLLSRAGGLIFIASGIWQAYNGLMSAGAPGVGAFELALITVAVALNFAVGVAGVMIPRYFSRYSAIWEYRLSESAKAEEELSKTIGGSR